MAPSPAPLRGLFIAGTDTGVGKTQIGCALLRRARQLGSRPIPFKPAETGATPTPEDAHRLHEAADPPVPSSEVCLYSLPLPAAPQAAAEAAGITISADHILARARHLAAAGDALLVEAAGGLLVPYAPDLTGADLAQLLGLPILLVARTALGTINHTALSVAEIRRRNLPLLGVLLCQATPAAEPHAHTNLALIQQLVGFAPLGVFPYLAARDPDALAQTLSQSLSPAAVEHLLRPLCAPAGASASVLPRT